MVWNQRELQVRFVARVAVANAGCNVLLMVVTLVKGRVATNAHFGGTRLAADH